MVAVFGPGPVRALQASRPVGAGPDAPHTLVPLGLSPPWYLGKQKHFSAVRLLSCRKSGSGEPHGSAANLTPPAMAPFPLPSSVKGTPAKYLHSQRHASVTDKRGGPFTPGPAQATNPPLCWSKPSRTPADSDRRPAARVWLRYVSSPPAAHCCLRPHARLLL
jgi:hypothetical protein